MCNASCNERPCGPRSRLPRTVPPRQAGGLASATPWQRVLPAASETSPSGTSTAGAGRRYDRQRRLCTLRGPRLVKAAAKPRGSRSTEPRGTRSR